MWLIILAASTRAFISHLIDPPLESAWSLRMNPWIKESSSTKVLWFPFVKRARPDGLKLLQLRMICNLWVEAARSTGTMAWKYSFFSLQKNASGHPEVHIVSVLGFEIFGRSCFISHKTWRWKVFLKSSNAPRVIKPLRIWPFFLWLWNMKHYF